MRKNLTKFQYIDIYKQIKKILYERLQEDKLVADIYGSEEENYGTDSLKCRKSKF